MKHVLMVLAFVVLLSTAHSSITLEFPLAEHFDSKNATKIAAYAGDTAILSGKMLGDVAPGQTLKLVFSRETGSNFFWDKMQTNNPEWNEKLSVGDKITLYLNIPKAASGIYSINITGTSSYDPGTIKTPEILPIQIRATNGTYAYSFPEHFEAIMDYPNSLFFRVKSTSLAADTLTFSILGFPASWAEPVKSDIEPFGEKTLFFKIDPMEERMRSYPISFSCLRDSGPIDLIPATIGISPATLITKFKAMSEGFSLIPVLLQPFYSLLSLFGFL